MSEKKRDYDEILEENRRLKAELEGIEQRKAEEINHRLLEQIKQKERIEARLNEAQHIGKIGHWTLDHITGNFECSREIFRIFEIPHGTKITYPHLLEYIYENNRDQIAENLWSNMEKGVQFSIRHRIKTYRNNVKSVSSVGFTEFNHEGQKTFTLGTIQDITDIKEKEEKLREVNEFNNLIFENSTHGILTYRYDGTCISSNELACKILGSNKIELLDSNIFEEGHWNNKEIISLSKTTIDSGRSNMITTVFVDNSNNKRWLDIYFSRFISKEEPHLLMMFRDVSVRVKAEKERDMYFNNSLALLCTTNPDGYFLSLNPAWEEVLGFSEKELMKKTFYDLVHPDDLEKSEYMMVNQSQGQGSLGFVNRFRCKNDSYRWLNWSSTRYDNVFYISAIDITTIKKNEETLKNMMTELERSNRDLEQFAYVSSHDLQEPLRKIRNYTDLLHSKYKDVIDEQGRNYIDVITRGTTRMQNLIDDLLSYSRVSTRAKKFELLDMNELVDEVLDNLELAIYNASATINKTEMPEIVADRSQLSMVFQNLISNALKFHGDNKPFIDIYANESRDFWQFTVKDNGIGMKMEFANKIFVVFQRLHSRNEYEGTGIGLAICKKIVERHHGNIWVESEPEQGAAFHFTISKSLTI